MKQWFNTLNKECSKGYDPVEAQQLFKQFRKRFSTASAVIQNVACKNAWTNLQNRINAKVFYLKDVPEHNSYTAFSERFAAAKAAEKALLDDALLKAEQRIEEYMKKVAADAVAGELQTSEINDTMDIDEAQESTENEVVMADVEDDKPEASVDLKAWMAKQEEVTSELQKTTTELQKSSVEMKTWMMQQAEKSSKIESLLEQLLAKKF